MKVLNAEQMRAWDEFTILKEPISSIDLMERASAACIRWMINNDLLPGTITIFCGKGNNGGDGLAIARLLANGGSDVQVYILENGSAGTSEFLQNLERIKVTERAKVNYITNNADIPSLNSDFLVDTLFGSGLTRPLEGVAKEIVTRINNSGIPVIAIDIPSGLFVDKSSKGNTTIHADYTLCFQCYKPALLLSENAEAIGNVHILDIGLHPDYEFSVSDYYEVIDRAMISDIFQPRKRFSHKGDFGHTLLVAGSYGKMGAAILCTEASLRTGSGLVTTHVPACGYTIMQTAVPEAMVEIDEHEHILSKIDVPKKAYDAIGIGPGIGTAPQTMMIMRQLFSDIHQPMVLDADALNILSLDKSLLNSIPGNSILTPHPREFERLFGSSSDQFEMLATAREKARSLNVIIVLKGHHTFIATPGGRSYFNITGNAGMATAGSGDVLTGILTSLIGQGYDPVNAAVMGVYLHGVAGDIAAKEMSQEGMISGDIVSKLGEAFLYVGSWRLEVGGSLDVHS